MKQKDTVLHSVSVLNAGESLEAEMAAMIHPLPENIAPSERFMQQMRSRLLQLQAAAASAGQQAA
jgi:hypothetical protein